MAQWEEIPFEGDEEERHGGDPEIRKRSGEEEDGREHRIDKTVASPGADDTEQATERETDDERYQSQQDGPEEARPNHVNNRRRKRGDRCSKVPTQRMS